MPAAELCRPDGGEYRQRTEAAVDLGKGGRPHLFGVAFSRATCTEVRDWWAGHVGPSPPIPDEEKRVAEAGANLDDVRRMVRYALKGGRAPLELEPHERLIVRGALCPLWDRARLGVTELPGHSKNPRKASISKSEETAACWACRRLGLPCFARAPDRCPSCGAPAPNRPNKRHCDRSHRTQAWSHRRSKRGLVVRRLLAMTPPLSAAEIADYLDACLPPCDEQSVGGELLDALLARLVGNGQIRLVSRGGGPRYTNSTSTKTT